MRIERAEGLGFCFGVKRALAILEDVARQKGGVETLGALVHNQQVMSRLNGLGVRVVKDVAEIAGDTVVISSHGVGPKVLSAIKSRGIGIVDTTCPFVQRAQTAARRLSEAGFFTVIYGDVNHPEVKGILGWAKARASPPCRLATSIKSSCRGTSASCPRPPRCRRGSSTSLRRLRNGHWLKTLNSGWWTPSATTSGSARPPP